MPSQGIWGNLYKITEQLSQSEAALNVVQVFPVWGSGISAQNYYEYMNARVEAGRRLILPKEIGCSLAHISAYRMIANSGIGGVIFEEDILFSAEHLHLIRDVVVNKIIGPDFVHFSIYRHEFKKTRIGQNLYVADTSSGFWGTSAYYVSPRMASHLLKCHERFLDIADNWQEFFLGTDFVPFYFPIFTHDGNTSRIGDRTRISQNASVRGVLELRWQRRMMTLSARFRHLRALRRARKMLTVLDSLITRGGGGSSGS